VFLNGYAVWTFIKFASAVSILMAVATQRHSGITDYYADNPVGRLQCDACYNRSLVEPGTIFEFGLCGDYSGRSGDNLLVHVGFFESRLLVSTVKQYIWLTALMFALVVLISGFIACFVIKMGDELEGAAAPTLLLLMKVSFLLVVFNMMIVNMLSSLWLDNNPASRCYVSTTSKSYIEGSQILLYIYLGFWFAQSLLSSNSAAEAKAFMGMCEFLVLFAYAIFSICSAAATYITAKDAIAIIFNVLGFASIFELPVALFGWAFFTKVLQILGRRG